MDLLARIEALEAQVKALQDGERFSAARGALFRQGRINSKQPGKPPVIAPLAERVLSVLPGLMKINEGRVTIRLLAATLNEPHPRTATAVRYLKYGKRVQYIQNGDGPPLVLPLGAKPPEPRLTAQQARFLAVMEKHHKDGLVTVSVRQLAIEAGSIGGRNGTFITDQLQKKGRIALINPGTTTVPATWRLLGRTGCSPVVKPDLSVDRAEPSVRRDDMHIELRRPPVQNATNVTARLLGDRPPGRPMAEPESGGAYRFQERRDTGRADARLRKF